MSALPSLGGPDPDDVLLIGYGPVARVLTTLLAQRGLRVRVVERWNESYPRPRAVHYDDEIARVFAAAGVGEEMAAVSEASGDYEWQTADGRTLVHFDWAAIGRSGWPAANMFNQPQAEAVFARRAESFDSVSVHWGMEAVQLVDHGDRVETTLRTVTGEEFTATARYVVGCDGANSFVRQHMATGVTDLGFFYDWLILDVVPHEQREWVPYNLQICNPKRPTTAVSGGPGRRRWEFMRLPGETVEELNNEATAWRLLEPWGLTPSNATLERHTVYTFQARWADQWRLGRLLIAGDAAHLMPPFAGQGMCSGIRDAANLAWKLDLVLSGLAPDTLLDTYTSERSAHIQHAIGLSVELGNVICVADPVAAAARDEIMLKADGDPALALPPLPPEVLGPGVLHRGADGGLVGPTGQLAPQGRVRVGDAEGRFDEVVGTGFVVAVGAAPPALDQAQLQMLARLGAHLVAFTAPDADAPPDGPWQAVTDSGGVYLPYLAEHGLAALVVRPDFYVFGCAADVADLPGLVDDLFAQLGVGTAARS